MPQPPGRTPHKAPQAPLRCPGGEDTPPEASEAPAREAMVRVLARSTRRPVGSHPCEPAGTSGGAAPEAVTGSRVRPEAIARQRRSLLASGHRAQHRGADVDPAGQGPGQRCTESVTRGGVRVRRTEEPFRADDIDHVCARADDRRGGVLSSGMEYPGRYSRWHMAYVNPCAELVARGRVVTARALNARGEVLLPVLDAALARAGRPAGHDRPGEVSVAIPEPAGLVAEEDRSRRPTVFSAVREVVGAFAGDDPHLGLYGAFGYDLAFQFEPVTPRFDRPAGQRDLVLHLPDELYVVDRKRETAMRYRYEFTVAGVSTEGLPRDTPASGGTGPDAAVGSHEKLPE